MYSDDSDATESEMADDITEEDGSMKPASKSKKQKPVQYSSLETINLGLVPDSISIQPSAQTNVQVPALISTPY